MTGDQSAQGTQQAQGLVIPPNVREKFGSLLALILQSESMSKDERQYWINILPAMTQDQLKNLEDILVHERDQLAAIDAKYAPSQTQDAPPIDVTAIGSQRRHAREKRLKREQAHDEKERLQEEDLLDQISHL